MQTVLLVEDDEAMVQVLRPQFEAAGVALEHVKDGYAAIECLRARNYEAVILDLVLSRGLSGFGVLNFVEMECPAVLDRIFLVTGMSEQTVIRAAPALLPRFFRKPIDAGQLVQAVLAVVRKPQPPPRGDGTTVLIVDDDAASAVAVQAIVEAAGWPARVVADGRGAIEAVDAGGIGAIVLDLVMPGLDGLAVIDYLRRRRPDLIWRTIVVSGLPTAFRERLSAPDVGANLEKPLRPSLLLEALTRCMQANA
jgi:DNA-binding response OmpR family regulator